MYTFIDNWCGDHYEFPTLREAKKRSKESHLRIPCLHLQRLSDCGDCTTERKSVTITIKNEII